jgi:hypothetical protein
MFHSRILIIVIVGLLQLALSFPVQLERPDLHPSKHYSPITAPPASTPTILIPYPPIHEELVMLEGEEKEVKETVYAVPPPLQKRVQSNVVQRRDYCEGDACNSVAWTT